MVTNNFFKKILKRCMNLKSKKKVSIFLVLTSITIFTMYIINKIIFFFSTIKELLYSENSNYYNWRFGKIFYTKKGTGTPILLIHDLTSSSSDLEWKELVNQLSERHTVYTLDLIGCGRSDKPNITYTNFLYVELISDFIKNVIKHKTDIIATGNSSSFSIMACYSDNQLFNNMILINPSDLTTLYRYPKRRNKMLKCIIDSPVLGTLIYNMIVCKTRINNKFTSDYYFNKLKIKKKYVNAYYESAHISGSSSKYLYSSIKCYYTNINIIHALKELNNSIYIIGGEYEHHIQQIIEEYINCNSSIEFDLIKETKHLPQLENPKDVLSHIELYLN